MPAGAQTQDLRFRAITSAVRALGPVRSPLALAVGAAWYATHSPEARRRAALNHRRLQPGLTLGAASRLARRSHVEYIRMMSDVVWAEPMSPEQIRQRFRIAGEEHLDTAGQGGILALSHFGNWDMAASVSLALGLQISTVMAPIGAAWVTAAVERSRSGKGMELFRPQQAARGLLRALRRGRMVALMIDVAEAGPTVVVPFCGGPVRVSSVLARLASATGAPIIPVACWREGRGWVLRINRPVASFGDEQEVMARVAAVLEPTVRAHPEQWYPFHRVYADSPE